MGNRANFVVVKDQDWQLYYSHWAGCRMLDALIAGPELALRYVQSLRPCGKNEWVSPLWADGGGVVDLDRRRVLFFGDGMMVDMNERRAVMRVLAEVWRDYEVVWAYDGTAELAGYVGAELRPESWDRQFKLRLARNRNSLCHLVSVVGDDGRLRFWPLWWHLSKAWLGPALLDRLPGRGVARLTLGKIPEGGVHIDVPRKTLGAWQTADTMGIFQALPDIWKGWKTECWDDRFEEQLTRCEGTLRLPELNLLSGIDNAQKWISDRVFQSHADSPAGQILKLAELLAPLGPDLEVSDEAVPDCGVRPRSGEWARFVAACNSVRETHVRSA
ncbi:hypothetical protein [Mycobacterium bourgelatii]|uniref:Uncharacterized protein n=1 Tax=Mycobacterium bourgelatii TaxID=1273442 RepID=A0A7I9YIP0_MYCBU|nr:hypothetical protein [Mycobacterium bourgelatii]GFG88479.1 hypothetical protein MBOU_05210 [Mycobacterium bourgelatii]